MTSKNKVFVIGIDAATLDLIKPWISKGELPTFAKLLNEGAYGNLKSVPNTNSAPAWVSFATGNNPGKHGIYYFDEPIFGTYKKRYLNASFRKCKAIWNYVSEAGKKVGVINVPITYPAEKINGFMVAGLDTPGIGCKGFTYPHSLSKELHSEVGDYIIETDINRLIKIGKKDLAVKHLFKAIDERYLYTQYLMEHFSWDLFIVVFTAVDAAQHYFWKDMDPEHPQYNEKEAKRYGSIILEVYQRLDRVLSSIMDQVGDSTIIIMSDHGGGFNQRGGDYINTWLVEMGLLKYKKSNRLKGNLIKVVKKVYDLVDKQLSREMKLKFTKILPGLREKVDAVTHLQNIDWTSTKAYSDGARDEIWINLKGREPQGIVEPGEEYEKLRDFISEKLSCCLDVENKKNVVKKVFKREEIYSGKYVFKAPDLFIQWRQDFVISGLLSENRINSSSGGDYKFIKPPLWSGGHRENGIVVLHGPSIRKNCELEKAEIIDMAPSILYLLGLPIPKNMDGRVLQEAIEEDYFRKNAPQYKSIGTELETILEEEYSEEEAKKMKEKLKGMGYID